MFVICFALWKIKKWLTKMFWAIIALLCAFLLIDSVNRLEWVYLQIWALFLNFQPLSHWLAQESVPGFASSARGCSAWIPRASNLAHSLRLLAAEYCAARRAIRSMKRSDLLPPLQCQLPSFSTDSKVSMSTDCWSLWMANGQFKHLKFDCQDCSQFDHEDHQCS